MRVKVYGDGWKELGEVRYAIEWDTVKPECLDKADIDPDMDIVGNVEYRATKDEAMKRGQEIYNDAVADPINLAWGVVQVRKEVVSWSDDDEGYGLAEWRDADDSEEIAGDFDYDEYAKGKAA